MKQGYQPKSCNLKNIVPPSVFTNVKPKKEGYTWEDLDKAWWEGFDTCKAKSGEANVKLNDELEKLKKQLEELKKQLEELPDKWCRNKDDYCPHLAKLEKENAELKCECKRCVYTDSPCVPSDYGKDRNGICDHFKDVFDENVELKLKLKALEGQTPWKDIKDKSELIKENTKLKEESKKIFNDWLNACDKYGKVNLKFTKAKEVIKKFSEFANNEVDYDPEHPQEYTDLWHKLCEEAEQFLKENE